VIGDDLTLVELRQRGRLREITPAMRDSLKLAVHEARRTMHEARRTMTWNLFICFVVFVALGWVGLQ
jgi:hypothetical protein